MFHTSGACGPVWPSGKALGCKRKDLGSIPLRLSFLFKKVVVCEHCLVILSKVPWCVLVGGSGFVMLVAMVVEVGGVVVCDVSGDGGGSR